MTSLPTIYPNTREQCVFQKDAERSLSLLFEAFRPAEPQVVEVGDFLRLHSYLIPILLESKPHIDRAFGSVRTYLDLEHDPEGGPPELFCVIAVKDDPEQALALLDRFDEEWFLEVANRTRNRLNFTVRIDDDEPL